MGNIPRSNPWPLSQVTMASQQNWGTYSANLRPVPISLPSNVIRVEQPAPKETPTESES